MLIFGIQDSLNYLQSPHKIQEREQFIESLTNDEAYLNQIEEIFTQVCKRLQIEFGESNMWIN